MVLHEPFTKETTARTKKLIGKYEDRVVTIGGLHGVLSEVNTDKSTVVIDCEGIFLEFDRAAIRTVTPGTGASVATEIEPADVVDETKADDTKE